MKQPQEPLIGNLHLFGTIENRGFTHGILWIPLVIKHRKTQRALESHSFADDLLLTTMFNSGGMMRMGLIHI